jgi:hypothetical protein
MSGCVRSSNLDTQAVYEREVGNVLGPTKFETLGDIGVALNELFNEIRCGAIGLRESRRHIAHLNLSESLATRDETQR